MFYTPAFTMLAALAAAHAGMNRVVTVCMGLGTDGDVANQASQIASKMFAAIGVRTQWREARQCSPRTDAMIVVTASYSTPKHFLPGALAFTQPLENSHIVVFYDRVQQSCARDAQPALLAHVLAHEIAHILEKNCRHSRTGVMKPFWSVGDLREMEWKGLPFSGDDGVLIRRGLSVRP